MTISHDTATVPAAYASTGTQTTSHAGSANTKAVVVLIAQNGTTTDEVSGVTYGGVAMIRLDRNTEATEPGAIYTYYLLNPPTGTQNVAMTTTAATNKQLMCATIIGDPLKAIKLAGARPYSFVGTSASAANPSWSMTGYTAGTKLEAYEAIHSGLQTMTNTPASGWTLVSSTDLGSQGRGFARQSVASSGTTLTAGWTAATAEDYVGASVAFWEDSNLVPESPNDSESFEDSTVGNWAGNTVFGAYVGSSVANSAVRASAGSKSLRVTHTASATLHSSAGGDVTGMVNGQAYRMSLDAYVPSGNPDIRMEVYFFGDSGWITTKDAWVSLSVDFIADSGLHAFAAVTGFQQNTAGKFVDIDNVRCVAITDINGVKQGSSDIDTAYVGSTAVDKMYVGTTQIWP